MKHIVLILAVMLLSNFPVCAFSLKKDHQTSGFQQSEQYFDISQKASALYAENNIKEAQNLLLSIPENQRAELNWLLLGNILQDQGKTDDAVFMYKKILTMNDKYYKAHYNLGNIYMSENKPNLAVEEFSKVVKIRPDYAYGHYNLACAYIKLGKLSKAKFELYNAIDLKNSEPDFYYNLIYILKKQKKEKEAKKYIEIYNKMTGEI